MINYPRTIAIMLIANSVPHAYISGDPNQPISSCIVDIKVHKCVR